MAGILLKWYDTNIGETGYRIYRSSQTFDENNLPPALADVGANVTEYHDPTPAPEETWYYRVATLYQGQEYLSDLLEVYVDPAMELGRVLWYKMDSFIPGTTNIADSQGTEDASGTSSLTVVATALGDALLFDGSNDHLAIPAGALQNLFDGTKNMSFYIVLRPDAFAPNDTSQNAHTIFSTRSEQNFFFQFGDNAPRNQISCRAEFSSSSWTTHLVDPLVPTLGEYYVWMVTYDPSSGWKLYRDGQVVDTSTITQGLRPGGAASGFSGYYGPSLTRTARFAAKEFALYNVTKTDAEALAIYNNLVSQGRAD